MMTEIHISVLEKIALGIRKSVFEIILTANSGHLGACSSSVELMTALYFGGILNYNPEYPKDPDRDRVYIRGHLGPLRYTIFSLLGWIDRAELKTYRQLGSNLKGQESMFHTPGIDLTPSGSLGMGLSYGVGSAIMTRHQGRKSKHFVFLGDGEEQEGNVSEAARHASHLGLDNLIGILDKNRKQLSIPVTDTDSKSDIKRIWEGYGWEVVEVNDGHNFNNILAAYQKAETADKPALIIAHTIKAKGLRGAETHFNGYHTIGSVGNKEVIEDAIRALDFELGGVDYYGIARDILRKHHISVRETTNLKKATLRKYGVNISINPNNNVKQDTAKLDYFRRLAEVVQKTDMPFFFLSPDLVYKQDAEFARLPEYAEYLDTGIREQHTLAMAHGLSHNNPDARIFLNCRDAFLYRSADQLNALAQGKSRVIVLSDLSGLTHGKNGETHHSSGQPAVPLFMPGVSFYEPADVQDFFNVLNHALSNNPGLVLIRSHRAPVEPLERRKEDKDNIDYYVTFESEKRPHITFVGSGWVLRGLVEASKTLESNYGINSRVINLINHKKLDAGFVGLIENDRPLLTVYNGNGKILQDNVSAAVMEHRLLRPSIIKGHGFEFGDTGSIEDLRKAYKFDGYGIIDVVRRYKKEFSIKGV